MMTKSVPEFVVAADQVGLQITAEQQDALWVAAQWLASGARARGLSQYEEPEAALMRAMAPALAFFAFDERPRQGLVADLGAGNGALGATIALLDPDIEVVLIDRAQRAHTMCEILIARMRLDNARVLLADLDTRPVERYDGLVFRALAAAGSALDLARAATRAEGFIGAYHAHDDADYLCPHEALQVIATVRTAVPDLVLTGYRT